MSDDILNDEGDIEDAPPELERAIMAVVLFNLHRAATPDWVVEWIPEKEDHNRDAVEHIRVYRTKGWYDPHMAQYDPPTDSLNTPRGEHVTDLLASQVREAYELGNGTDPYR